MALTPSLLFQRDKANKAAASGLSTSFRSALLIVDLQNDFCDPVNGALPMQGGTLDIAPSINGLLEMQGFTLRIATLSCRPEVQESLKQIKEVATSVETLVELKNTKMAYEDESIQRPVGPEHCRRGTWGHKIIDGINQERIDIFLEKNLRPEVTMRSAFKQMNENIVRSRAGGLASHNLEEILRSKAITHLYCVGTCGESSLAETAIDAISLGLNVYVIEDVIRSLDATGQEWSSAVRKMQSRNVQIIKLKDMEVQRVKHI